MKHRRLVQLFTIVMLLAGLQGFAADMRKGPYLIYPNNPKKMTVLIQANGLPTTSSIRWGTTTDYSNGTADMEVFGDDHQYRKTIEGLTPNTRYFYEVDLDGTKHTGSFRSAPAVDATSAVIYATGDTRTNPSNVNKVLHAMVNDINEDVENRESVWLHCGDWVDGDKEHRWDQYFEREYPDTLETMRRISTMGCRGNHEDGADNYYKYWPYAETVEQTTVPLPEPEPESLIHYYSFDYGPVHIAVVDCMSDVKQESDQYKWLVADLQASTKPWTILQWHKPAYSSGGHGSSGYMQDMVENLQAEGITIDVVNAGHNHLYVRIEVDGIVHLTTGGGGVSGTTKPGSLGGIIKAGYQGFSFARLEVVGSNLFGEVKNEKGEVVDTFRIAKGSRLLSDSERFTEDQANDGSFSDKPVITLHDANFAADVVSGGHITTKHLPNGLTASFVRDSDTQVTMSLTGNAIEHGNNGIKTAQIVFSDEAFNGATAADIAFTTKDFTLKFSNPQIISTGDEWRYMKGTSEPPSDWKTLAFDDSAWLIGATPIGDKGTTRLNDLSDYSTVFLRRKFTVQNPDSITKAELSVGYDDGFAVYLNGTLVALKNASEPITYESTANDAGGGTWSGDVTETASDLFKKGTNVIAIVLLNRGLGGDARIAPELFLGGDSKPTAK